MGEPLPIAKASNKTEFTNDNSTFHNKFDSRISKELVVGFAGPVGSGISTVIEHTKNSLENRGYKVHIIKLSEFIQNSISSGVIKIDDEDRSKLGRAKRYLDLQDGGNELRKVFNHDILAEYAIKQIVGYRGQSMPEPMKATPKSFVPNKVAYLIDQIKHPHEVQLLRKLYRNIFHLIGVVSVESKRLDRLEHSEHISRALATRIMERDKKEELTNGQQLDKALKMADFFIRSDRGNVEVIKDQIKRFIALLHSENGITPTKQEYGMYVAYAASLRSACLSRQVGAAIEDTNGEIISTGCNDVPKAGGGLYSMEDGANDKRCIHREEQICFNDREKNSLRNQIKQALQEAKQSDSIKKLIAIEDIDKLIDEVYEASRIYDLTEFSRAVHAEMDAIVTLVRTGTPGIKGATLFCTTFPCHSCARHILAAGIRKVYYIEPYEKSLAQHLHSDAIEVDTEDDEVESSSSENSPCRFIHFEGVAPSQYINFFKMGKRKKDGGRVFSIATPSAGKSVNEFLDDYRDFESKVIEHFKEILPDL